MIDVYIKMRIIMEIIGVCIIVFAIVIASIMAWHEHNR